MKMDRTDDERMAVNQQEGEGREGAGGLREGH